MWSFAFLLTGVAYLSGLSIDLTGDGGLYGAITRQMVESGDWLNLKINGELYEQKPHLLFWLAGIGVQLFGNTNVAFKIFPVLYGWLGFYFTYRLGKTLFTKETGKLAALMIATSQVFYLYSFDIHTDIVLQTGVVLALWQLAEYLKKQKTQHFLFGFLGIGLAMLAKGPVGAVIPFFAVLFYLIAKKDFSQLFHLKWFFGILIVLAVISPSLIHLFKSFGWLGIEFYFITNNFGRISGEYAGSSTDPFYYLYNSIWIFFPWTILVFTAIYNEIKSWFSKGKSDVWGISLLGSVLLYILVISIARGKAPNYFLIAVSPLIVITAKWMEKCKDFQPKKFKWVTYIHGSFVTLTALSLIIAMVIITNITAWFIILSLLSLVVFVIYFKQESSFLSRSIYGSVLFIGLLNVFMNLRVVPELSQYQGARQVLEIFEKYHDEDDKLYNWDIGEHELFFMNDEHVKNINSWEEMFEIMKKTETWLYTNEQKRDEILDMGYKIDTVYSIKRRGLNEISLEFLNPETRTSSLKNNYLIRVK